MAAHELVIARLPGRTGLYLGFQDGGVWRSVARFSHGEESAEEFMAWARRSGIRCEDDRKEGEGERSGPVVRGG